MRVSDQTLLQAWRDGDNGAGNALLDRHFDALYRFFWNKVDEPDELVQDTLLACVKGRERVRGEFSAYLFAVARNRLVSFWEKARRDRSRIDYGTVSAIDLGSSPSQLAVTRGEHRRLLHALRAIPVDDQMILELHYWEGLSGGSLAAILEVPEGTVRGRLRRAKQLLQAKLDEDGTGAASPAGFDTWARQLREYADRELGRVPQ